jgi:hypothetical protein
MLTELPELIDRYMPDLRNRNKISFAKISPLHGTRELSTVWPTARLIAGGHIGAKPKRKDLAASTWPSLRSGLMQHFALILKEGAELMLLLILGPTRSVTLRGRRIRISERRAADCGEEDISTTKFNVESVLQAGSLLNSTT